MTQPFAASTVAAERRQAIDDTLADVRRLIAGRAIDRALLDTVIARLEQLAQHKQLFGRADFPPPSITAGVGASTRYRLNAEDGDDGLTLYLNSINPGKTTWPHNHTTWAVIVAVEGEEHNRLYTRTDDGRNPAHATLAVARDYTVRPGSPIAFMPEDIHSIHVTGQTPTLHFHLYGLPLERLTGRIGIDPATGTVHNYNATQMTPSAVAA